MASDAAGHDGSGSRVEASQNAGSPARKTNGREMFFSILTSVLFDVVLSIVIFQVAKNNGASDVAAYLWASIGPLLGLAFEFLRHRRVDVVGVVILAIILVSAGISLIGSTDPKALLLKDSVFTGAIGLIILASLTPLLPRPLMFYMGRKFGTDGTDAGVAWWNSLWQYEGFRHSQRVITAVWGVGFLVEAILKTAWVLMLPFDTAYTLNQIGPLVVTIGLMIWTMAYAGKARRAGEERGRLREQARQS